MTETSQPVVATVEVEVVSVAGPEAVSYLQGQLSQDLDRLAVGSTAWSFVLAPDGKVDALLRVHRRADDHVDLVVDAGFGQAVADRLNRFKLRTDCEINLRTVTATAVRGAPPPAGADPASVVDACWPTPGFDVLDGGPTGDLAADLDAREIGRDEFDALRIEAGIPVMGHDLEPGALAASSGIVERAVDFAKGCFVGQELVARMHSRGGTAPKRLVRLDAGAQTAGALEPAAIVTADGAEAGEVTSAAGTVALALVSHKLDPAASPEVTVGGVSVVVTELADPAEPVT